MLAVAVALGISARPKAPQPTLQYDPNAGEARVMTMHDGSTIRYTAYERLYFVTNIEDSAYQFLNVYVPEGATQQTSIFLRTYVGGYMASAAGQPQAGDASGRALKEGYVLVIPGSRGRNSTVIADKKDKKKGIKKGQTLYTGRAPAAILDLKAAIRYLRHFDGVMPGDAEKIITDGTSAGGAMSSLMAMRDSFTLMIKFPASEFTTVTVPPTVKPRVSKCRLTSSLPPIFLTIVYSRRHYAHCR